MRRCLPGRGEWTGAARSVAGARRSVLRCVEGPQRVYLHVLGLRDRDRAAPAGDVRHHSPGDVHGGLHVLRRTDDQELVPRRQGMPLDHERTGGAGDRRGDAGPDAVDLHRLGAGAAQLLDRIEDVGDPHLVAGVTDGHDQPGATGGGGAVGGGDRLVPPASLLEGGRGPAAGAVELLEGRALLGDLLAEPLLAGVDLVEDADEILLTGTDQLVALIGVADLHGEGEAEQQREDADQRRGQRVPPAPGPDPGLRRSLLRPCRGIGPGRRGLGGRGGAGGGRGACPGGGASGSGVWASLTSGWPTSGSLTSGSLTSGSLTSASL